MSQMRRMCVTALLVTALSACGSGARPVTQFADDAGRAAARLLRSADELPSGAVRPQRLPSVTVPPAVADDADSLVASRTAEILGPHFDDSRNVDEATVSAACGAMDLYEAGQAATWEDAAAQALADFGGDPTRHARVRNLAEDLSQNSGLGDIVSTLAVFSACEAAA